MLERTNQIITLTSLDQLPSAERIRSLPREILLTLVFEKEVQKYRQATGQKLKEQLPGFQVGVHVSEPKIRLAKLITQEEIQQHQEFFERCARDYRSLGERLIHELANEFEVDIDSGNPNESFYRLKRDGRQTGALEGWRYFLHGIHCEFVNKTTGQTIEVCLIYGLEFGDLDPYFFSRFIKSTPQYQPLPVEIYEDHADGSRIIEQMLLLGKFETVNINEGFRPAIVVTDRGKMAGNSEEKEKRNNALKLLRFFGLK